MEEFPPNSRKSRTPDPVEKRVERVTSGDAVRRKKPLMRQFQETFIGGDTKSAIHYVLFSVLIPAAKDALVEAGSQGFEKLIFGESRRNKLGGRIPQNPSTNYVSYNRYSTRDPSSAPNPNLSRRARAQHDFDEIVLTSRAEAEEVLERLFDLLSQYDSVSVADLYELTGIKITHTDQKWGWTNLRGSGVTRTRQGYLLDLPSPEPLDS